MSCHRACLCIDVDVACNLNHVLSCSTGYVKIPLKLLDKITVRNLTLSKVTILNAKFAYVQYIRFTGSCILICTYCTEIYDWNFRSSNLCQKFCVFRVVQPSIVNVNNYWINRMMSLTISQHDHANKSNQYHIVSIDVMCNVRYWICFIDFIDTVYIYDHVWINRQQQIMSYHIRKCFIDIFVIVMSSVSRRATLESDTVYRHFRNRVVRRCISYMDVNVDVNVDDILSAWTAFYPRGQHILSAWTVDSTFCPRGSILFCRGCINVIGM